ncbi:elongation of very long chain fatty acids protein 4-like [Athalia rosae]|uniref:elongation of very long chain fatty acids protein 4-like n=1 Tax=Athalia rosae TaxID=37344 RepID=UPI0020343388|nr:elongation of very long chain fatty acids protein 4-like [Athalia rosae]
MNLLNMFDRPIPHFLEKYLGVPDAAVYGWPGLENPSLMIVLYALYAVLLSYGRRWMKPAAPFRLRGVLVAYNILQIFLSGYILAEVVACASTGYYSLSCGPVPIKNPTTTRLARAIWLFYLSKMVDLMDTVFFVLRKKDEQITFLHVYHHVAMIIAWYLGALYTPGGQAWLSVVINAGIHVLMYLYYMVSALGSSYRKYLWWKKYLTQIQLVQFIVVGAQVTYLIHKGCARPMWLAHVAFVYNVTLIFLFLGFYREAYGEKNEKTKILDPRSAEQSELNKKKS